MTLVSLQNSYLLLVCFLVWQHTNFCSVDRWMEGWKMFGQFPPMCPFVVSLTRRAHPCAHTICIFGTRAGSRAVVSLPHFFPFSSSFRHALRRRRLCASQRALEAIHRRQRQLVRGNSWFFVSDSWKMCWCRIRGSLLCLGQRHRVLGFVGFRVELVRWMEIWVGLLGL